MTARRSDPLSPGHWHVRGRAPTLPFTAHCSEGSAFSCMGLLPQGGDRCYLLPHRCCHQDPHRVRGTGRRPWDTRCKELLLFPPSRAERGWWWEGASSLPGVLLCGIGLSNGTTRAETQPDGSAAEQQSQAQRGSAGLWVGLGPAFPLCCRLSTMPSPMGPPV